VAKGARSPAERRLDAQRAVRASWQHTRNRTARTQRGRDAFLEKLADLADPDHEWSEAERQAAAEQGLLAHMLKMSKLAAEARRRKNGNAAA
jgi:acetyl-CoA carboxylase carboxyltransferase component